MDNDENDDEDTLIMILLDQSHLMHPKYLSKVGGGRAPFAVDN